MIGLVRGYLASSFALEVSESWRSGEANRRGRKERKLVRVHSCQIDQHMTDLGFVDHDVNHVFRRPLQRHLESRMYSVCNRSNGFDRSCHGRPGWANPESHLDKPAIVDRCSS